ncbi:MAG: hypothetical protein FJ206_05755 [Gemmatimonadetes bacterium]|nr:hypothetical protein [Gemmatimonadota bacterium]
MRLNVWMVAAATLAAAGCASLQQLAALRQVDFALASLGQARVAGIDLARITAYQKLGPLDVARVAVALSRNDLPLEFVLNVKAENPANNKVTAKMVRMGWSLFLQEKETISGIIDQAIELPPGQPQTIPMTMRVNLLQFFNGPAQDLFDLAVALAGADPDPKKVSLRATPTIETPLGPINYPTPITVVSRTFGGTPKP